MQRFEDGVCGELVIVRCLFVEDGRWATMVCFVCFLEEPAGGWLHGRLWCMRALFRGVELKSSEHLDDSTD